MKRRGFTLLEMIVVCGLVAFAGLVSMRLFRATLRTWGQSANEQAVQSRFDQSTNQLRRDVWSADSVKVLNENAIEIHRTGMTISWKIDGSGISRTADHPADTRNWPSLGKLTFEARGPMVVVHLAPAHEEAGGQIVLMSQTMLLAGRSQ